MKILLIAAIILAIISIALLLIVYARQEKLLDTTAMLEAEYKGLKRYVAKD